MTDRPGYMMTADDIVWRYGSGPRKPRKPVYAFACDYDLGCDGPTCRNPKCPRRQQQTGGSQETAA